MKARLKIYLTAIAALMPQPIAGVALRALGHRVDSGVKIGFSLLLIEHMALQHGARIGQFNVLRLRRLVMRTGAYFGRMNLVHGPLSISMAERSAIGNNNKVVRAAINTITIGPALLRLGELTKITAGHRIDCTSSVYIGNFSTIAGIATEIWTHGYVHAEHGPGRYRVDGNVSIGCNVYVGSSSCITAGVQIADGIIVGARTTVATNLLEPGMYVSAGIRRLARPADPDARVDLERINDARLCETVYRKRRPV